MLSNSLKILIKSKNENTIFEKMVFSFKKA